MVENVKCQEFDKNVLPLTATNLSLSDCAQKCLNEHKCLSFHHVTQQQFTDGHSCELAAIECPVGVLMTSDSLFSRNFHYVKGNQSSLSNEYLIFLFLQPTSIGIFFLQFHLVFKCSVMQPAV